MNLEYQVDLLREEVTRLTQLIEHLTARNPNAAPPMRIVPVKQSSGTTYKLQDWDGSNYVDLPLASGVASSEREITVENTGLARAIWSPVANRWELLLGGAWLGVLAGDLDYHSSATVNLYKWDDTSGYFIDASQTATCYPWCLKSGDSIASGTQVMGIILGGKYVVYEACCSTGT